LCPSRRWLVPDNVEEPNVYRCLVVVADLHRGESVVAGDDRAGVIDGFHHQVRGDRAGQLDRGDVADGDPYVVDLGDTGAGEDQDVDRAESSRDEHHPAVAAVHGSDRHIGQRAAVSVQGDERQGRHERAPTGVADLQHLVYDILTAVGEIREGELTGRVCQQARHQAAAAAEQDGDNGGKNSQGQACGQGRRPGVGPGRVVCRRRGRRGWQGNDVCLHGPSSIQNSLTPPTRYIPLHVLPRAQGRAVLDRQGVDRTDLHHQLGRPSETP
jgi:hypothetical protein